MAYDYSVATPGPIAPLDYVERSIEGVLEATGAPEKIVLGVPVYGRNWPVALSGTCPPSADVPGVVPVTARTVDELIARRGATPVFDESTGESSFAYELPFDDASTSCVQTRQVNYVDAAGVALRMDLARQDFEGDVVERLGREETLGDATRGGKGLRIRQRDAIHAAARPTHGPSASPPAKLAPK